MVFLLLRLREHVEEAWCLMYDPEVPFTHHIAGQAMRMPKVKQKIPGCFRSTNSADIFCIIRYMYPQEAHLIEVLTKTFFGFAPHPSDLQ